ncbi:MAG: hypothetical protein MJZ75_06585 [Paludibacteraceae bacterium]|nr:hypothetical protein [Paludibacteraceae bacterium]
MPSSEYKKHLLFEDEIIVSKNDGSKKRVFTDPHEAHAYYEDIRTEELQDEAARAQITAVEQNKQILKNQQKLIENQQKGTQMPRFNAPQITHQVLDPQYKEWLQFQQETDPAYLKWKAKKEEDARRIRMENDRKRREYEEKERLHREEQKKKGTAKERGRKKTSAEKMS